MEPGDKIKLKKSDGEEIQGILMPRSELADKNHITLKIDSGYNIGIEKEEIGKVEVLEKAEKKRENKEKIRKIKINEEKPTVALLGCGGTIASKIDYETGAVKPSFSLKNLIEFVPELKSISNIRAKELFDVLSENISPKHWQKIAKECKNQIEKGVDGIVIAHGTDTMHYTAAALSFMLKGLPVPVVLTGAQRSSDRGSCDSRMNLTCAFKAATSDIAEVMVCMHGEMDDSYCLLHQGTHIRKMHSSRRDAFRSINKEPYAKTGFKENKFEYLREDFRKKDKTREVELKGELDPNVGIIWIHPGIKPSFIKQAAKEYDGLVLVGTGLGNAPVGEGKHVKSILPVLKKIGKKKPVIMTTQTLNGRVDMKVYSTGRKLLRAGVIPSYTLPEVALVKLMWVLGQEKELKEVKKRMMEEEVGEFNKRITPETFPNLD